MRGGVDDGGQGAVGRRRQGVVQGLGDFDNAGAGAQEDVRGVTAVEAAAVIQGGVAVFKEAVAVFRQAVLVAGGAGAATVGDTPGQAVVKCQAVHFRSQVDYSSHSFVAQDAGGGFVAMTGKSV